MHFQAPHKRRRKLMPGPAIMLPRVALLRLKLTNFRNHQSSTITPDGVSVVLCGANGAGKTNVLEAVSFLAPGRGLRRATLSEVTYAMPAAIMRLLGAYGPWRRGLTVLMSLSMWAPGSIRIIKVRGSVGSSASMA